MPAYSPERRTAVVFSGSGLHGAYHAGALRALQEAGVKVDLLAGHGAGAATAALAAIGGQSRLWDPDGLWVGPSAATFYQWTKPARLVAGLCAAVAALLVVPVALVLATGLAAYAVAFLLDTVGLGAGQSVVLGFNALLARAMASNAAPTFIPRLALIGVAVLAGVFLAAAGRAAWRGRTGRTIGAPWWRVLGAPIDATTIHHALSRILWQLIGGAGGAGQPSLAALGRRYAEVLGESLGQPGFRELIVAATDIDSHRDVVGVLLKQPYAQDFLASRPNRERDADVLDFSGAGQEQAIALVAASLTPPVAAEPATVTFAAEGFWRGETHRVCDRPGIVHRVLEEIAAAGVTQVVVVSACAEVAGPHHLQPSRVDPRHRMGEFLVAAEAAALRDALETARLRFDAVYLIRPAHNPLGPFDAGGVYDRASDRRVDVAELVRRGHDDASRQFIEPVVGASGERLARPAVGGDRLELGMLAPSDTIADSHGPPAEVVPTDPVARRRARVARVFGDAD